MTTTEVRGRRRPTLVAILLAILLALVAIAAAALLRPRQDAVMVTDLPMANLPKEVSSAIRNAGDHHVKALLLGIRFTAEGSSAVSCPVDAIKDAARQISGAPLPVIVFVAADNEEANACAAAFGSAAGITRAANSSEAVTRYLAGARRLDLNGDPIPPLQGSGPLLLRLPILGLLLAVLLAALAWWLLSRPRQQRLLPAADTRPERPEPPSPLPPTSAPTPAWPRGAHPLAGRLRQPQPAEIRSVLDPAGFVAFEGGLWRAAWADPSQPPPGVGASVLIQYDQRTAQIVAVHHR
jgi:hypothetical protein